MSFPYSGPQSALCDPLASPMMQIIGENYAVEFQAILNGNSPPPEPPFWLIDMDGDGLEDLLVYNGDGYGGSSESGGSSFGVFQYYPGRGDGYFGDNECVPTPAGLVCTCSQAQPVTMSGAPDIGNPPHNVIPYYIHDVTGDGLADLIVPDAGSGGSLIVYPNLDGTRFGNPQLIPLDTVTDFNVVTSQVTFADINGTGVDDIVVITDSVIHYFDLYQGGRPFLLTGISNGLGATTTISYDSAAKLAVEAAAAGAPWSSRSPQSSSVVTTIETTNGLAGGTHAIDTTTTFAYKNPVYDLREHTFLGFQEVQSTVAADAAVQAQTTIVDFAIDATPVGYAGVDDPYESVRALPVVVQVQGNGGNLSLTHNQYNFALSATGFDGRNVYRVYNEQSDEWLWDSPNDATEPLTLTDVNAPGYPDINATRSVVVPGGLGSLATPLTHLRQSRALNAEGGNLRDRTDWGALSGGLVVDQPIMTSFRWGLQGDPGNWNWRPTDRVTGYTSGGAPGRDVSFTYDGAGNLTDVYGVLSGSVPLLRFHEDPSAQTALAPPTASVDGTVHLLHRTMDPSGDGNALLVQGASGQCAGYGFDSHFQQYAVQTTVYAGNGVAGACGTESLATVRMFDAGIDQVTLVVGPNGATSTTTYDGFGRLTATYEPDPDVPGLPSALPSRSVQYFVQPDAPTRVHVTVLSSVRKSLGHKGLTATHRQGWRYYDSLSNPLVTLIQADPAAGDGGDWVVTGVTDVSLNDHLQHAYQPEFYSGDASAYDVNRATGTAHTSLEYDGFGRPYRVLDLDGTLAAGIEYHALSRVIFDADDLEPSSPHVNTPTTVRFDGHGRTVETDEINQGQPITTAWTYQATGEVTQLQRTSGTSSYSHSATYDTLGRMVQNFEPNSTASQTLGFMGNARGWRYAYDDAGDLVGTSDARGCGENIYYDAAGRTLAEDFSPCQIGQPTYSTPNLATAVGTEAYYVYDTAEAGDPWTTGTAGKLTAVLDRATHSRIHYDLRGRVVDIQRQLAVPSAAEISDPGSRYALHWYDTSQTYDEANEVVSQTTGADATELLAAGASVVTGTYSARGMLTSIGSSYGSLVAASTYDADGLPLQTTYGDAQATKSTFTYDALRRVHERKVYRSGGLAGHRTTANVLEDSVFSYDRAGNPTDIADLRAAVDWPAGAKPVSRKNIVYDDLYELKSLQYDSGNDTFVPPDTGLPNALPDAQPPLRVRSQSFSYDGQGNTTATSDDANAFFDRSLGTIQNGAGTAGPNQLTSATNGTDFVSAHYDQAGDLADLTVQRTSNCTAGACTHRFAYLWDELGHLMHARRWDIVGPYSPSLPQYPLLPEGPADVTETMAYDASGQRVLKSVSSSQDMGASRSDTTYFAEIFPTLRLDGAGFDGTDYEHDASTETVYLGLAGSALGRLVYDAPATLPGHQTQHVLLEITDHLGSTSTVIDSVTGDLVERSTYQAFGAADSDYRPDPWQFWERYRFTGKEADVELGLAYFGARYYSPYLNRWMSADPLAVHAFGGDPNPYGYVGGNTLRLVDPLGLDPSDHSQDTTPLPPQAPPTPPPGQGVVANGTLYMGTVTIASSKDSSQNDYQSQQHEEPRQPITVTSVLRDVGTGIANGFKAHPGSMLGNPALDVTVNFVRDVRVAADKDASKVDRGIAGAGIILSIVPGPEGAVEHEVAGAFRETKAIVDETRGAAAEGLANQLPERLAGELAAAEEVGAVPVKATAESLAKVANQGTLKWVVTTAGDLVIISHDVGGVEISHAVLSGGNPVLAAGHAEIAAGGGQLVGMSINASSGHFGQGAVEIGRAAFAALGVSF